MSRPTVYTPFLRRFTDEPARELSETIALYEEVQRAHQQSPWAQTDIIERMNNHCADIIQKLATLPDHLPLAEALDRCQSDLIAYEETIVSFPQINWQRAHLSMQEQVDLRRFLRAKQYFLANQDRVFERWVTALCNVFGGIIQSLPPFAESAFSLPLISLFSNPNDVVDRIIGTIYTPELGDVGLFTIVQAQIYKNMCAFSGVPLYGTSKKPLITANEADLAPEDLLDSYLADTPFHSLLLTPVPFALPEETRFSGHWIIAPPGRGKTTLLHAMFFEDVCRDASIIVMDSKGELSGPIRNLKAIQDRLVLIEPNSDFPLALNPLNIPRANLAQTRELVQYIFASLMGLKFTELQRALFRNLLPAVLRLPNPTLGSLRKVLINGLPKDEITLLDPRQQDFFTDTIHGFNSDTYRGTRREIVWRIDDVMSNDILRTMFEATTTKLDIGRLMDEGRVIVIDNSKRLLGKEGCEFFGRFFLSLILSSAHQRGDRPPSQKKPCYVYIDECHDIISRDTSVPEIIDQCRSQKIAIILAHQRSDQLSDEVLDAVANCAIRMANSDDDAKYLSDKLRMNSDQLRALPRGTFATFVRDLTPAAVALKIPFKDLSKLPRMSAPEQQTIQNRMRDQFCFTPQSKASSTPSLSPQSAKPSPDSAKPHPGSSPGDPHTGEHTKPASRWGDA